LITHTILGVFKDLFEEVNLTFEVLYFYECFTKFILSAWIQILREFVEIWTVCQDIGLCPGGPHPSVELDMWKGKMPTINYHSVDPKMVIYTFLGAFLYVGIYLFQLYILYSFLHAVIKVTKRIFKTVFTFVKYEILDLTNKPKRLQSVMRTANRYVLKLRCLQTGPEANISAVPLIKGGAVDGAHVVAIGYLEKDSINSRFFQRPGFVQVGTGTVALGPRGTYQLWTAQHVIKSIVDLGKTPCAMSLRAVITPNEGVKPYRSWRAQPPLNINSWETVDHASKILGMATNFDSAVTTLTKDNLSVLGVRPMKIGTKIPQLASVILIRTDEDGKMEVKKSLGGLNRTDKPFILSHITNTRPGDSGAPVVHNNKLVGLQLGTELRGGKEVNVVFDLVTANQWVEATARKKEMRIRREKERLFKSLKDLDPSVEIITGPEHDSGPSAEWYEREYDIIMRKTKNDSDLLEEMETFAKIYNPDYDPYPDIDEDDFAIEERWNRMVKGKGPEMADRDSSPSKNDNEEKALDLYHAGLLLSSWSNTKYIDELIKMFNLETHLGTKVGELRMQVYLEDRDEVRKIAQSMIDEAIESGDLKVGKNTGPEGKYESEDPERANNLMRAARTFKYQHPAFTNIEEFVKNYRLREYVGDYVDEIINIFLHHWDDEDLVDTVREKLLLEAEQSNPFPPMSGPESALAQQSNFGDGASVKDTLNGDSLRDFVLTNKILMESIEKLRTDLDSLSKIVKQEKDLLKSDKGESSRQIPPATKTKLKAKSAKKSLTRSQRRARKRARLEEEKLKQLASLSNQKDESSSKNPKVTPEQLINIAKAAISTNTTGATSNQ
jgi:hypothetical protein